MSEREVKILGEHKGWRYTASPIGLDKDDRWNVSRSKLSKRVFLVKANGLAQAQRVVDRDIERRT